MLPESQKEIGIQSEKKTDLNLALPTKKRPGAKQRRWKHTIINMAHDFLQ